MPRKIKALIKDLKKAGFMNRGGKGSHKNFVDLENGICITVSGKNGKDALPYQEKAVALAIAGAKK